MHQAIKCWQAKHQQRMLHAQLYSQRCALLHVKLSEQIPSW